MASNWNDDADQQTLGPQRSSSTLLMGLFVLLAVLVVGVVVGRRLSSRSHHVQPAVGKPFALLQLTPLRDQGQPLTAGDLQGKVTLVNFWGPWCPPCRIEFPELMELRERLAKQDDFQFISVTCMPDDNEGDLARLTEEFLKSKGYELPVYRDPRMITRLEFLRLNQEESFSYPTTVLIDQQGVVQGVWIGYSPGIAAKMRQRIEGLLAEGRQPAS